MLPSSFAVNDKKILLLNCIHWILLLTFIAQRTTINVALRSQNSRTEGGLESFCSMLYNCLHFSVVLASRDEAHKTDDGLFSCKFYFQSYTARMGKGKEEMGKMKQNSQDKTQVLRFLRFSRWSWHVWEGSGESCIPPQLYSGVRSVGERHWPQPMNYVLCQ